MRNGYEIRGQVTAIFLKRKDGEILETLIDTNELPRAQEFNGSWYAQWNPSTRSYYVCGYSKMVQGKRKCELLHRWIMSNPEQMDVDHISHKTLDNKKQNLRCISHQENIQNRKSANKNSKSGIRGVHWDQRSGKWQAQTAFF
ncbi:MAG: HNH endonuclease [Ruminiclostridium sp.]